MTEPAPDAELRNIVLTGFMGTGKSTVGQIVAWRLGWPYVDTDWVVEHNAGRSVPDIISQDGEEPFRRLEKAACLEVAARREQVIATGGGALLDANNRAVMLMDNLLICLTCEPGELAERLAGDKSRPLLGHDPAARIGELLSVRRHLYDALPVHVDTTGRIPNDIASEVLNLWHQT